MVALSLLVVSLIGYAFAYTVSGFPIDLAVYQWGGLNALDHASQLYDGKWGNFLPFTYPPFSALVFSTVAHLSLSLVRKMISVLTIACLAGVVWAAWGMAGYRRGTSRLAATLLVTAGVLWLEPVQQTLGFGQVNVLLMALVVGDLALPDSRRWKGIGIGIATGFKLTPGVFIVYLLMIRRFRAAAVATATTLSTILIGFLVVPHQAAQYWGGDATDSSRVGPTNYISDQSVSGLLSRLAPGSNTKDIALVLGVVVGAVALLTAAHAYARGDALLGLLLAASSALMASPISWTHHFVWLAPATVYIAHVLYQRRATWGWLLLAAWLALFAAWPSRLDQFGHWDPHAPMTPNGLIWMVPHRNDRESHWNPYEEIAGNFYVLVVLALVLISFWYVFGEQIKGWLAGRQRRGGSTGRDQTGDSAAAPAQSEHAAFSAHR
jgi:alpha-1,2-mannosyltransferase